MPHQEGSEGAEKVRNKEGGYTIQKPHFLNNQILRNQEDLSRYHKDGKQQNKDDIFKGKLYSGKGIACHGAEEKLCHYRNHCR